MSIRIGKNLREYFTNPTVRNATGTLLTTGRGAFPLEQWNSGVIDFCEAYCAAVSIQNEYVHFLFEFMCGVFKSKNFLDLSIRDLSTSKYDMRGCFHPNFIWDDGLYYKFYFDGSDDVFSAFTQWNEGWGLSLCIQKERGSEIKELDGFELKKDGWFYLLEKHQEIFQNGEKEFVLSDEILNIIVNGVRELSSS